MSEIETDNQIAATGDELNSQFGKAKEALQFIINHETVNRKTKYRLCVSMISMLITEMGCELYPRFNMPELNLVFSHIKSCISEMAQHQSEQEDDDESEEAQSEAKGVSEMLIKVAQELSSGKATVETVKLDV